MVSWEGCTRMYVVHMTWGTRWGLMMSGSLPPGTRGPREQDVHGDASILSLQRALPVSRSGPWTRWHSASLIIVHSGAEWLRSFRTSMNTVTPDYLLTDRKMIFTWDTATPHSSTPPHPTPHTPSRATFSYINVHVLADNLLFVREDSRSVSSAVVRIRNVRADLDTPPLSNF